MTQTNEPFTIKCKACGGSGHGKECFLRSILSKYYRAPHPIWECRYKCPDCKGEGGWHPIILKRECGECGGIGCKTPRNREKKHMDSGCLSCCDADLCSCDDGVISRPATNEEVLEIVENHTSDMVEDHEGNCVLDNEFRFNDITWRVVVNDRADIGNNVDTDIRENVNTDMEVE